MSRASLPYEKNRCTWQRLFRERFFGKKRGRKRGSTQKRGITACRRLCIFRIPEVFELPVTELKTKFDFFMNGEFREKPALP